VHQNVPLKDNCKSINNNKQIYKYTTCDSQKCFPEIENVAQGVKH